MKHFSKFIASGFGTGYLPKAPGTWGTFGAFLLILPLFICNVKSPDLILFTLILVFTILGIWSANKVENEWGQDAGKIVIDEMVGFWISILFINFTWFNFIAAFILFRFFDILKPMGIRKAEKLKGGYGVMADDVIAGIIANFTLRTILYFI